MNQKELTKTFMIISNWKNPLDTMVYIKIIQRFRGWGGRSTYSDNTVWHCVFTGRTDKFCFWHSRVTVGTHSLLLFFLCFVRFPKTTHKQWNKLKGWMCNLWFNRNEKKSSDLWKIALFQWILPQIYPGHQKYLENSHNKIQMILRSKYFLIRNLKMILLVVGAKKKNIIEQTTFL